MRRSLFFLALIAAAPAAAQDSLQARVEAKLAEAPTGTRFGMVVATEDGQEIVAVNPEGRFVPASNTKMFSTAAAFATLPGVNEPDVAGGNAVRLEGRDVVLEGHGDARMSSAADCTTDCLATLAGAIAARTKRVRDVIGDDSLFPDQRWSPGMSWNNIPTRSGTGISALTLDDNEVAMTVTPSEPGKPPRIELSTPYYVIDNRAVTFKGGANRIGYDRLPFERVVRVTGSIGVDARPDVSRMGIDDPAHYAAWRLKALLEARGVKVTGRVRVRHRPLTAGERTAAGSVTPHRPEAAPLARLVPPPLAEDLKHINKVSQNLHAELALRRVGLVEGDGSIGDGVDQIGKMLGKAGVPRTAWDFSDGSGMSTYNRVSPRGVVTFLRWVTEQPWGAQWRDTLPTAGSEGTLARRFRGSPLENRLWAKTGTINATNALAGYLTAASGKTLVFAIYANDMPQSVSATRYMDEALALVAAAN